MKIDTTVKLGTAANLMLGFNAAWDPLDKNSTALYSVQSKPLKEWDIEIEAADPSWGYPEISLHESAESLLSELFPYRIVPVPTEQDPPAIPAGPLLIGDKDRDKALKSLSATLGVDLSKANHRYALVTLTRTAGIAAHPCYRGDILIIPQPSEPDPALGVDETFRQGLIRLRHAGPQELTAEMANSYLYYGKKYGTHFVSKVTAGDRIFQVFAYPSDRFKLLAEAARKRPELLSGPDAVALDYYTTDRNKGEYGFVVEYGKIISLSGDPAIQTSVAADWKESKWANNRPSVFAPFEANTGINREEMNKQFTAVAPIRIELTSLGVFGGHRRLRNYGRVMKGAMAHKYGNAITSNFSTFGAADFGSLLPHDDTQILSTIATPTISLYKSLIDLKDMGLIATEEVKSFTLTANAVQHSGDSAAAIPGTDVALVAQVFDFSKAPAGRRMVMTDSAFDRHAMACKEFYGALVIVNTSGTKHRTIVDGLVYELAANAASDRYEVAVTGDVRRVPDAATLEKIKNNWTLSFTFAEMVAGAATTPADSPLVAFMRAYLRWLVEAIPADSRDIDLADMRMRAMELTTFAANRTPRAIVPLLPPDDYRQQVTDILDYGHDIYDQILRYQEKIDSRKKDELLIDVATTLNQNIVDTGQLLSGVVDANTAQQADLATYYQGIVDARKNELESQQASVLDLEVKLKSQQSSVSDAVTKYQIAFKEWEKAEQNRIAIEVIKGLFELGAAIGAPETAEANITQLVKLANKIKKILEVLQAAYKVYDELQTGIDSLQRAQRSMEGIGERDAIPPSQLEWDEMKTTIEATLSYAPDDEEVKAARTELLKEFEILILRGKAMLSAKNSVQQIARDLYTNRRMQELTARQADRLAKFKNALKPGQIDQLDRTQIDLVGLTGHLVNIRVQMLAFLAKAFAIHDQALQYEYLQKPTPITSFSLLGFKKAIYEQGQLTIQAKTKLGALQASVTKPIDIVIEGVDPSQLINGNVYLFSVMLDNALFDEYVSARVKSVVTKVEGVSSTESGVYLLNLAYQGSLFEDRDPDRNPLVFQTPRRERTYEYRVEGNVPDFTDEGQSWSDKVSQVTPFSTWEISFPKTKKNKGIKFSGTLVKITLSFTLDARIKDRPVLLYAVAAEPLTTEQLVGQMYAQGSALNGWDVVFSMTQEKINQSLKAQYEELKATNQYYQKIEVDTKTPITKKSWSIKKFKMTYGYPRLEFLANNNESVKLIMQIVSGSLQSCLQMGDGAPECDDPINVAGKTMTANVAISMIKGDVNTAQSVALEFQNGSFDVSQIELGDEEKVEFNRTLKAYFAEHQVRYLINTLDLRNVSALDALTPRQFIFKTLKTPAGKNILQLYIETASRNLLDNSQAHLNNIPEPIPDGEECSLMISSNVTFSEVLSHILNNQGWSIEGEEDKERPNHPWMGKFTKGTFTGKVDLSKINIDSVKDEYTLDQYGNVNGYETVHRKRTITLAGGNSIQPSIKGMTLRSNTHGALDLYLKIDTRQDFHVYDGEKRDSGPWKSTDTDYTTQVSIEINASLPLSIDGAGRDQNVSIKVLTSAVNFTGHMSGGGSCNTDDMEAQFNAQLRAQVPEQIKKQLNVPFKAISVFALKNLLFPSRNYISFTRAYLPGDLLIVGKFNQDA